MSLILKSYTHHTGPNSSFAGQRTLHYCGIELPVSRERPNGGQAELWRRRGDFGFEPITLDGVRIAPIAAPRGFEEPTHRIGKDYVRQTARVTLWVGSSKMRLKPLAAGYKR